MKKGQTLRKLLLRCKITEILPHIGETIFTYEFLHIASAIFCILLTWLVFIVWNIPKLIISLMR
jgi:hypothetical protein